jgi:hypothetical protein
MVLPLLNILYEKTVGTITITNVVAIKHTKANISENTSDVMT